MLTHIKFYCSIFFIKQSLSLPIDRDHHRILSQQGTESDDFELLNSYVLLGKGETADPIQKSGGIKVHCLNYSSLTYWYSMIGCCMDEK